MTRLVKSMRRAPSPRPAIAPQSLRIAAIDVGSNSVHMVIAQADTDGGLVTICRMKEMVPLAAAAYPTRSIPRAEMDRAITALARFQQVAIQRNCEKIRCVATSAVRAATNGGDFLERIKSELGLDARIISGREEARLIYLGVRHTCRMSAKTLILDIGGGSVEFIVGDDRHSAMLESRKLGAARMTARFVSSDPISEADLAALIQHYQREMAPIIEQIQRHKPTRVIGTSGSLESIASICRAGSGNNGDSGHPDVIDRSEFFPLLATLLQSSDKDREKIAGLDAARRGQVVAASVLVGQIFERLRLKRIEICKSALREGVLLDYLSRNIPDLTIRQQIPEPRRRSVIALARRCAWHKTHSEQVARLCLALFDQLKSVHGLDAAARELIECGALLHDIGWHIGQQGHHKHSMYLVLNGGLRNFTPDEVWIIANVARYHRKTPPRKKHAEFQALSPQGRRIVCVGAALLRLADGLDRSHASVVDDLRCRVGAEQVKCAVVTRWDAQLEIWGANRKRDMFESTFKRPIIFELAKA
ncbi:MAG: Ppx/GppA family phosphatase [Gemmatimonadaceae bacterium]|nr:Ppx/GppA family phosphatase [Gemmatimonadaceae bacterium]